MVNAVGSLINFKKPVTTDPERERPPAIGGEAIRLALALISLAMGISLLSKREMKA